MKTPASLLERLQRPGEEQAWARFVELYTPLLHYWARRAGCREADAADLVQDILTLLVCKLPQFHYKEGGSFRSWLRAVTLNKWREKRRHESLHPCPGCNGLPEVPGPDAQAAFEEAEYRRYLVHRALTALEPELPPLTWAAFQQYALDGRDPVAVGRELGISTGSVYAAKSRVLTRLRQELQGLLE